MTQRFSFWDDLTITREPGLRRPHVRRSQSPRCRAEVPGGPRPHQPRRSSWPANCRADGSSAWRWPPACCTIPCCCCSTNPPPASIPRRGAISGMSCKAWRRAGISVLVSTHYMDEASRCHKLAYIAYGKLLAQGTAAEVIASQHLSSWAIYGDHLMRLAGNAAHAARGGADGYLRRRSCTSAEPTPRLLQRSVDATVAGQGAARREDRYQPGRCLHLHDEPLGRQLRRPGMSSATASPSSAGGALSARSSCSCGATASPSR